MSMAANHKNYIGGMDRYCLPIYVDIATKVRYDVGYQITGGAGNASKLYL